MNFAEWLRWLLTRTHKNLEYVVAGLLCAELVGFIWGFLGEHASPAWLHKFLAENRFEIGLSAVSTLIVLVLLSAVGRLLISRAHLLRQIQKHHDCDTLFRQLAQHNAMHDKQIFTRLFVNMRNTNSPTARRNEIENAITEAKFNLIEILNIIRDIFVKVTANQCCVCVQIVESVVGLDRGNAIIRTVIRCTYSEALRGGVATVGHPVRDNTVHRRIFMNDERIVCIDDLQTAKSRGQFDTTSATWSEHYNALLVASIPYMEEDASMPRATLCIDNKGGGFEDAVSRTLAQELVLRLAVKLYRLEQMVKSLE